jgi:hypothetical protein
MATISPSRVVTSARLIFPARVFRRGAGGERLKGPDDADDRAQQTKERRDRSDHVEDIGGTIETSRLLLPRLFDGVLDLERTECGFLKSREADRHDPREK